MRSRMIYPAGNNAALRYASEFLEYMGAQITQKPDDRVTHLLLPVPSFENGCIRDGWRLESILATLPGDITVIGGKVDHPALEKYRRLDLLEDPFYLAENAEITAHCALKLSLSQLPVTLAGQPVLVIGWGRIGKCLARLLRTLGAQVCVQARKESDRAILHALGYAPRQALDGYRVIFNTVPAQVIPNEEYELCSGDCLKIDLASVSAMPGNDVLWARGLPGKDAPESAGLLIARTIRRLLEDGV